MHLHAVHLLHPDRQSRLHAGVVDLVSGSGGRGEVFRIIAVELAQPFRPELRAQYREKIGAGEVGEAPHLREIGRGQLRQNPAERLFRPVRIAFRLLFRGVADPLQQSPCRLLLKWRQFQLPVERRSEHRAGQCAGRRLHRSAFEQQSAEP